ncbi:MAG: M48 family metallopeptidase [Bacteroidota bacterium]|nr:M48 family metallopeptidase [Bacteroidota bacterium]
MKRFIVIACFILIITSIGMSQSVDINNFYSLESSGKNIPDDFRKRITDKFNDQKNVFTSKDDSKKTIKNKMEYLQVSNYWLDKYITGGKVIFNDTISKYLGMIAENLLKDNKPLAKSLRFYLTKSPGANAYSFDQGVILVNIGLIAQTENEAQIAFILAHEISHYLRKHGMEKYLHSKKISSTYGVGYLNDDQRLLSERKYSRKSEFEADVDAFNNFYKNSEYSINALIKGFDVLEYSYLPFEDIKFEKSFLETEYLKIPNEYVLKNVKPVGFLNYNDNDSLSTHPNTQKRIDTISFLAKNIDDSKRKSFILPEQQFRYIQNLARFETIRQFIIRGSIGRALYNSYVMLKYFPDNQFLQTTTASALYYISKYKTYDTISEILADTSKVEGEAQNMYNILYSLDEKELNTIALRYIWNLKKKYPDNSYLNSIYKDLLIDLIVVNKMKLNDFSDKYNPSARDSASVKDTIPKTKFDKIRKQRDKQNKIISNRKNFIKYAFVDLLHDKNFVNEFSETEKNKSNYQSKIDNIENEKLKENISYTYSTKIEYKRKIRKSKIPEYKSMGYQLGIDSILMVEPEYEELDERYNDEIVCVNSDNQVKEFQNIIKKNSSLAGLNAQFLNLKDFNDIDVSKFNDIVTIKEWEREIVGNHYVDLIPFESIYMKKISTKYKIKKICKTSVYALQLTKSQRKDLELDLCYGELKNSHNLFKAYAYMFYNLLSVFNFHSNYVSIYHNVVYDLDASNMIMNTRIFTFSKPSADYLNSKTYDCFKQIKNK